MPVGLAAVRRAAVPLAAVRLPAVRLVPVRLAAVPQVPARKVSARRPDGPAQGARPPGPGGRGAPYRAGRDGDTGRGERPGARGPFRAGRPTTGRPASGRPAPGRAGGRPFADRDAAGRQPRGAGSRSGPARTGSLPDIPANLTESQLDPAAAAELRTLPSDLASAVGRRLLAASLADDPEAGYQHALEARRLAARVGIVRETTGIAAYRAGHWAEALAELRAARRLTGRTSYLPLIADSERALGRIDRALGVIAQSAKLKLDRATEVELRIVESGIRRDQGLAEAAVVVLQLPELKERRVRPWSARLFYAYADALLDAGRTEQAREWFARAAAADPDELTDAAERFDDLDDLVIDDLGGEDGHEDQDEDDEDQDDGGDVADWGDDDVADD